MGTGHGRRAAGFARGQLRRRLFYQSITSTTRRPISARVVNQSFIFANPDGSHLSTNEEQPRLIPPTTITRFNMACCLSPAQATAGRFIRRQRVTTASAWGVSAAVPVIGPTSDGRSKPDIVSPGSGATSFSTPFVSGSAAVLMQAALRGDGGADTNSANDNRTIKALLLNGAVKPADWTNTE